MAGVPNLQHPDIAGNLLSGLVTGTKLRQHREGEQRQNRLADLASQSYTAPTADRPNLLALMARESPEAAAAQQQQFQTDEDRRSKKLTGMVSYMLGAIKSGNPAAAQGAWNNVRPALAQEFPDAQYGEQWTPEYEEALHGYAAQLGLTSGAQRNMVVSPGSAVVDPATGQVVYERPFAPAKAELVDVPDGNGGTVQMLYDPTSGGLRMPNYPGQPESPPPIASGAAGASAHVTPLRDEGGHHATFQELAASFPGTRITSLNRTPEQNARLPNSVPNSQHLDGTAGDFVVPQQHRQAFIASARQRGYEVIDNYADGHIHLELPPGGVRGGNGGFAGGGLGTTPPKRGDAPAGFRFMADGQTLEAIPGGPQDSSSPASAIREEQSLRKETNDLLKQDRSIIGMFSNVQTAARNPSAAGDLSMIFAFMKMLDPGSVVREQEFANAQNAAGVPDRIRNVWNRALEGQRLNESQRQDFLTNAQNLAAQAQGRISNTTRQYQGIAEQYGLDTQRSTGQPDFRNVTNQTPSAGSQPTQVRSADDYNAIPSGATYVTPDGMIRRKP